MFTYNGIIHSIEDARAMGYRVTIVQPGHVNPPAIQSTFLIDDHDMIDFFTRYKGWPVYGSIDEHGYMDTCNHEW